MTPKNVKYHNESESPSTHQMIYDLLNFGQMHLLAIVAVFSHNMKCTHNHDDTDVIINATKTVEALIIFIAE